MIPINLLPTREERRKANLRQLAVLLGATLVGSLLLVAAFHAKLRSDVESEKTLLADTQRQIDQFKPQLDQVAAFRQKKSQLEKKIDVIDELDRARSGPVRVLSELASRTPDRLWLTSLKTEGKLVLMKGASLDNELVALFLRSLGESAYFAEVDLDRTKMGGSSKTGLKLVEFSIRAVLVNPASAADA